LTSSLSIRLTLFPCRLPLNPSPLAPLPSLRHRPEQPWILPNEYSPLIVSFFSFFEHDVYTRNSVLPTLRSPFFQPFPLRLTLTPFYLRCTSFSSAFDCPLPFPLKSLRFLQRITLHLGRVFEISSYHGEPPFSLLEAPRPCVLHCHDHQLWLDIWVYILPGEPSVPEDPSPLLSFFVESSILSSSKDAVASDAFPPSFPPLSQPKFEERPIVVRPCSCCEPPSFPIVYYFSLFFFPCCLETTGLFMAFLSLPSKSSFCNRLNFNYKLSLTSPVVSPFSKTFPPLLAFPPPDSLLQHWSPSRRRLICLFLHVLDDQWSVLDGIFLPSLLGILFFHPSAPPPVPRPWLCGRFRVLFLNPISSPLFSDICVKPKGEDWVGFRLSFYVPPLIFLSQKSPIKAIN